MTTKWCRRGVANLLDEAADLTVVGLAGTAAEALTRIPAARPDVAVLDVRLPDGNGVEVCRELRRRLPELNYPMLTSHTDQEAMMAAFMAGAGGFVIKDVTGFDLHRRGPHRRLDIGDGGGTATGCPDDLPVLVRCHRGNSVCRSGKTSARWSWRGWSWSV